MNSNFIDEDVRVFDPRQPVISPPDCMELAVQMHMGLRIPLRDGVHLSATLYLPRRHAQPSPAICMVTPYVGQTYHERGMYFAGHGYPFLIADTRGRGNSEGVFIPTVGEGEDGYDVVEWLAQQPFCNGKVAMWGGSYSGASQWATAAQLPPHLCTIVPAASSYVGVDFPARNNIFSTYVMQWFTLVWGRASQDKIFWEDQTSWRARFREWFENGIAYEHLDTSIGVPCPTFQEWVKHPCLDAYWDGHNPSIERYSRINIPTLTITGIYDEDQPGALTHYRKLQQAVGGGYENVHYLIIGPWDHAGTRSPKDEFCGISCGAASLVDLGKLHLEWFAWIMQRGEFPSFLRNKVAYYVMGAERWRYADTLEAVTATLEPLYLRSTGNPVDVFSSGQLLSRPVSRCEPDWFIYDPRDVTHAALESTIDPRDMTDQRMVHALIGKQLIYHTPPFQETAEVSGFFRLAIWMAIDQPDTDFRVVIQEILINGDAIVLSTDMKRARYRESLREGHLIQSKEPLLYDFTGFTFVSRQIQAGSRLRLVIGPVNSIFFEKNYNSGGVVAKETMKDARPVVVTVFHDECHPSVLYVPYGSPAA